MPNAGVITSSEWRPALLLIETLSRYRSPETSELAQRSAPETISTVPSESMIAVSASVNSP